MFHFVVSYFADLTKIPWLYLVRCESTPMHSYRRRVANVIDVSFHLHKDVIRFWSRTFQKSLLSALLCDVCLSFLDMIETDELL